MYNTGIKQSTILKIHILNKGNLKIQTSCILLMLILLMYFSDTNNFNLNKCIFNLNK